MKEEEDAAPVQVAEDNTSKTSPMTTAKRIQDILGSTLRSLVPNLADILGARKRLKPPSHNPVNARFIDPPKAPKTFLDDIREGTYALKQVL